MGTTLKHNDYREKLENLNGQFLYLNDLDPETDAELISRLTRMTFTTTSFSLIPSCACGETTKQNTPNIKEGDLCPYCYTEITTHSNRKIESRLWIRPPKDVKAFLSPWFVTTLLDVYKTKGSGSTVIHWLLDPYDNGFDQVEVINYLQYHGVKRGINYFVENADRIMELLNNDDIFRKDNAKRNQLYVTYLKNKHLLFPTDIPITDKSFNIHEKSHLGSYVDQGTVRPYMAAVNAILGLKRLRRPPSVSRQEHVAAKVCFSLANYYESYISSFHNVKSGEYRRGVYGGRLPWTSRQVITSIVEPHDYDEMHFPWKAAIPLYEHHITNYLLKRGYTPNQCKSKILTAINVFDQEIADILDDIIATSPFHTAYSKKPGLMHLHNRNPTLKIGSIQTVYITKIKHDLNDITKSISVLTQSVMNSDFDGEQSHRLQISSVTLKGYL